MPISFAHINGRIITWLKFKNNLEPANKMLIFAEKGGEMIRRGINLRLVMMLLALLLFATYSKAQAWKVCENAVKSLTTKAPMYRKMWLPSTSINQKFWQGTLKYQPLKLKPPLPQTNSGIKNISPIVKMYNNPTTITPSQKSLLIQATVELLHKEKAESSQEDKNEKPAPDLIKEVIEMMHRVSTTTYIDFKLEIRDQSLDIEILKMNEYGYTAA